MITIKLMGGLGNQMFQYAFVKSLSLKFKQTLNLDLSFLCSKNHGPNFTYRDYNLDIFNISANVNLPIENYIQITEPSFPNHQWNKSIINEIENIFNSNINPHMRVNPHLFLQGYWQSPKYFNNFKSQINEEFTFKNCIENTNGSIKNIYDKINSTNSVLIHVRRADYLNDPIFNIIDIDYIKSSIDMIKSKTSNLHYYIFSDDIQWCVNNLKLDNMTIIENDQNKDSKCNYYFQLMKSCKHFITSNSTFSWWAAWLSQNTDKIIISPKLWFKNPSINTEDKIPENWIRL